MLKPRLVHDFTYSQSAERSGCSYSWFVLLPLPCAPSSLSWRFRSHRRCVIPVRPHSFSPIRAIPTKRSTMSAGSIGTPRTAALASLAHTDRTPKPSPSSCTPPSPSLTLPNLNVPTIYSRRFPLYEDFKARYSVRPFLPSPPPSSLPHLKHL